MSISYALKLVTLQCIVNTSALFEVFRSIVMSSMQQEAKALKLAYAGGEAAGERVIGFLRNSER